jgi:hypothetical protein
MSKLRTGAAREKQISEAVASVLPSGEVGGRGLGDHTIVPIYPLREAGERRFGRSHMFAQTLAGVKRPAPERLRGKQ